MFAPTAFCRKNHLEIYTNKLFIVKGIDQWYRHRIAEVEIFVARERCHVKNNGRREELLVPGARVYAAKAEKPDRTSAGMTRRLPQESDRSCTG